MLEVVPQDGLHFCRAFIIKQEIKALIYKLFNQAHALSKGQIVFFLLVSQSGDECCNFYVVCYKVICYEGCLNGLQISLRFPFDGPGIVLLLQFASDVGFPGGIIFSIL